MVNDDDGGVQIVVVWLWREGGGEGGENIWIYGSDGTYSKMKTYMVSFCSRFLHSRIGNSHRFVVSCLAIT
jgi:hypothetical protein